jgi:hypothetical protein
MFENKVLMRIFVPKREEVTGGWEKVYNKELHNSYSVPNLIKINQGEWDGKV